VLSVERQNLCQVGNANIAHLKKLQPVADVGVSLAAGYADKSVFPQKIGGDDEVCEWML
jgi:hypothetical protein